MNLLFVLFRTVHIFGSVLWVGSAIVWMFYIQPAIKASGPAGTGVLQNIVGKRKYPLYMNTVALLTILSGAYLIVVDSGGLKLNWILSGPGLGFTIGSVVGIAVFFVGMLGLSPRGKRLGELGREILSSGVPPSPAQQAEIQKIDKEMGLFERIDFVMLTIAMLTMVTARFWYF